MAAIKLSSQQVLDIQTLSKDAGYEVFLAILNNVPEAIESMLKVKDCADKIWQIRVAHEDGNHRAVKYMLQVADKGAEIMEQIAEGYRQGHHQGHQRAIKDMLKVTDCRKKMGQIQAAYYYKFDNAVKDMLKVKDCWKKMRIVLEAYDTDNVKCVEGVLEVADQGWKTMEDTLNVINQ